MIAKLRAMLRRKLVKRLDVPDVPFALERLVARGVDPRFVFDVGAHRGDFAKLVLSLWPQAKVACFEPIREFAQDIVKLKASHPAIDLHQTLVGASEKPAVDVHVIGTATSVRRFAGSDDCPVETLPQTTLDAVVRDSYAGVAPDFLKLDVQGYEMDVLKGAEGVLKQSRVILSEVNILEIYDGTSLLDEMLMWLSQRGFVTYDICGVMRRPYDQALWQADMIFVRRDDPLRKHRGYLENVDLQS